MEIMYDELRLAANTVVCCLCFPCMLLLSLIYACQINLQGNHLSEVLKKGKRKRLGNYCGIIPVRESGAFRYSDSEPGVAGKLDVAVLLSKIWTAVKIPLETSTRTFQLLQSKLHDDGSLPLYVRSFGE